MFKELDPVIHSQLRLAVMSVLAGVESAEFVYLKEKTNATAGNLSVQLEKLRQAGYIEIEKTFKGKYPLTVCRMTAAGAEAFRKYISNLQTYLK